MSDNMLLLLTELLTLSVTQVTFQQSVSQFSVPRSNFGRALTNVFLDILYHITHSDCAKECFYSKRCKNFHYNTTRKACTLNKIHSSEASPHQWTYSEDLVFSDKEQWPKAIAGSCADEPCGSREKCIPSRPHRCVGYCGVPWHFSNGFFWIGCTTAGCKLKHACNNGYVSTLPGAKTLCQENGRWTSYNFQCIAHCGHPPSVGNATVGPGLEVQDTNRTYTCQEPYTASSSSTTISCLENSTWTAPDFQCN